MVASGNDHDVEIVFGDETTAPANPHLHFSYYAKHSDDGADTYSINVTNSVWDGGDNNVYLLQTGTVTRTGVNIWENTAEYIGFKVKIMKNVADEFYATFYMDANNDGLFSLVATHALSSGTPPTYVHEFCFFCDNGNGDNIFLDTIVVKDETTTNSPAEIATLTYCTTHNERDLGGTFTARARDLTLTNYSTLKEYLWQAVEIWNNALTEVLWEGWITNINFAYNHVTFTGSNILKIVNDINADHNGILAEGEVTTSGADSIDDVNATFTSALVGKTCTFTDTAGPTYELDYPNSNSEFREDDWAATLSLDTEVGDHTRVDSREEEWPNYWYGKASESYGGVYLEFDVANGSSSTGFEIQLDIQMEDIDKYDGGYPEIDIYDDEGSTWEKVIDPISDYDEYTIDWADLNRAVATYYFDETNKLKLFIDWGSILASAESCGLYFAQVKNYYSTPFSAGEIVYVIDSQDSNTLTFTGQTPNADGVAVGDRYVVGDYLHSILDTVWSKVGLDYISLDYDDSTNSEAVDYTTTSIGEVLRKFAQMDGRHLWHAKGWVIKSSSTLIDTGIDLTEADFEVDQHLEDWTYNLDGFNIKKNIKVIGAGCVGEDTQSPAYPSPLGLVHTDTRISSQEAANTLSAQLKIDHTSEKKTLQEVVVNADSLSGSSQIDVMKTIDVALYSSTITVTAGEIVSVSYSQTRGGNLFCGMMIEG